jgi:hypothetical protein
LFDSLAKWGNFKEWKNCRPWLKKWQKYFLRLLNGTIYASSLDYLLKERSELKFVRPIHSLVGSAYNVYLNILSPLVKEG